MKYTKRDLRAKISSAVIKMENVLLLMTSDTNMSAILLHVFAYCRLKEVLRAKLTECGWKDQMKAHCKGTNTSKNVKNMSGPASQT